MYLCTSNIMYDISCVYNTVYINLYIYKVDISYYITWRPTGFTWHEDGMCNKG